MDREREAYWQSEWAQAGIARAERVPGREKFYAIVAYPGPSGFLHLGHLRGMLIADALHRYHRMRGRQVFFPTGTHATGLPAVTFAQRVQDRDPFVVAQLREHEIPETEWSRLEDPAYAARFLGRQYLLLFRRLGLLADESAYLTTIDDDYQAFIRWQFHRLNDAGVLVQGPHYSSVCPVCGPVSVDPSETDLSAGGNAETVLYTTVPFRLDDGRILLAATLRPETVYGVTNLWLHPSAPLVVWHLGEHEFLVSHAVAPRLVDQHGGRAGSLVPPDHLIGRGVRVPLTDHEVPILASPVVEPARGTGVVMSVPGHAPADWLALRELDEASRSKVGAIPVIIDVPNEAPLTPSERELLSGEGVPAERACRAVGAATLTDEDAREEATERLYRVELLRGRMEAEFAAAAPVARAREETRAGLEKLPGGMEVREFSIPVLCRNGHEVVIRKVPDQWFLKYSDPEWKAETRSRLTSMTIRPAEYSRALPGILDWFDDRPCTRRGRWLGTPFPLDPTWLIEPIADSTFYPAYFPVRRFVASGRVPTEALTDAFFDYVFLGRGSGEPGLSREVQDEVREEFRYWYPLDVNIGGKEHMRVHFPVFLFTHARLLPETLGPRGLFVHFWLTLSGGVKISKKHGASKGGVIPPIQIALERWGADALRLFYAQAANPEQDIEWSPELADIASGRLEEVERVARSFGATGPERGAAPELEAWLLSAMHEAVARAQSAFESMSLREAAEIAYVEIPGLLRRYQLRGGAGGFALQRVVTAWIRLLAPITPHVAEELAGRPNGRLVAEAKFPDSADFPHLPAALRAEEYLSRVEEDLRGVLKPASARGEVPDGVVFFVAAPWKVPVERWLRDWASAGGKGSPLREVMERARAHPETQAYLGLIPRYVERVAPAIRYEPAPAGGQVDEAALLRSAEGFLARRFDFHVVTVLAELQGEAEDPLGRRDRARPGRPAFYLLGVHAGQQKPGASPATGDGS